MLNPLAALVEALANAAGPGAQLVASAVSYRDKALSNERNWDGNDAAQPGPGLQTVLTEYGGELAQTGNSALNRMADAAASELLMRGVDLLSEERQ
jgi:hypothetical protein